MKKLIYAVAVALVALSTAACSDKGKQYDKRDGDRKEVYTGVLPAADASGIRYTLALDYDDDNGYTDGDYKLVQTYLVSDSVARLKYRDSVSFKDKGDFTVTAQNGRKVIKLTPSPKSKQGEILYFLVDNDSTITLTMASLEAPVDTMLNYSLKLVK